MSAVVDAMPFTLRFVVVAPFCPIENTVVDALVTASKRLPVPQVVSLEYEVEVPMLMLPIAFMRILSLPFV